MAKHRIILDCDPGVDDAIALLLAMASPEEIELIGITCVAGNVPLADTTRNALRVCALAGRSDVPVFAGCERPLLPDGRNPGGVHGTDGLGDIGLADGSLRPQPQHAVDFIIDAVMRSPGEITLCPIGPMTNIGLAMVKQPAIAARIRSIVFMGGAAFCPGNSTPEAEFNIWFDPHAAQIMVSAGIPLVMFGLDVTRQARMTPERLNALGKDAGRVMAAALAMLRHYGGGDPCLHDPCVIAALIEPSLFDGVEARVTVECSSGLTCGRTTAAVSERHRNGMPTTCRVITGVDQARLFALLETRLRRLDGGASPAALALSDRKHGG